MAWSWVKHVRGHSSGKKQISLLKHVGSLLPKKAPVFVVGDSEFGSLRSALAPFVRDCVIWSIARIDAT
jgi:hypothetical protein